MNYFFLNTNFSCKLQGKCWKDDMLSVTDSKSERNYWMVNKIKEKSSFGHHVGGQEYALEDGIQYKSYYFIEKIKVP